ncbi:MAG: hypothetical protein AAF153_00165 [Pseudomonadota bacterium]
MTDKERLNYTELDHPIARKLQAEKNSWRDLMARNQGKLSNASQPQASVAPEGEGLQKMRETMSYKGMLINKAVNKYQQFVKGLLASGEPIKDFEDKQIVFHSKVWDELGELLPVNRAGLKVNNDTIDSIFNRGDWQLLSNKLEVAKLGCLEHRVNDFANSIVFDFNNNPDQSFVDAQSFLTEIKTKAQNILSAEHYAEFERNATEKLEAKINDIPARSLELVMHEYVKSMTLTGDPRVDFNKAKDSLRDIIDDFKSKFGSNFVMPKKHEAALLADAFVEGVLIKVADAALRADSSEVNKLTSYLEEVVKIPGQLMFKDTSQVPHQFISRLFPQGITYKTKINGMVDMEGIDSVLKLVKHVVLGALTPDLVQAQFTSTTTKEARDKVAMVDSFLGECFGDDVRKIKAEHFANISNGNMLHVTLDRHMVNLEKGSQNARDLLQANQPQRQTILDRMKAAWQKFKEMLRPRTVHKDRFEANVHDREQSKRPSRIFIRAPGNQGEGFVR